MDRYENTELLAKLDGVKLRLLSSLRLLAATTLLGQFIRFAAYDKLQYKTSSTRVNRESSPY